MGNSPSKQLDTEPGMTKFEILDMRATWMRFTARRENGAVLFLNLFESHPETMEVFPFAGVPLDVLTKNIQFIAHVTAVLTQLAATVDALDDAVLLRQLITKISRIHRYRRAVLPKHFEMFAKSLSLSCASVPLTCRVLSEVGKHFCVYLWRSCETFTRRCRLRRSIPETSDEYTYMPKW